MSEEKKESGLVKIGALWKAKEDSKAALTGKLGDANLIIFKNGYKEESKHPDYIVYVSNPMKKKEGSGSDDSEVPF